MFFIANGSVEVVSEDGKLVFTTLNKGQYFGDISLVFSCPHNNSIRAATNCDLFVLSKPDLDRILTSFPHVAQQIRTLAGRRFNLVKKLNQRFAKGGVRMQSPETVGKTGETGAYIYSLIKRRDAMCDFFLMLYI